MIEVAEHLTQVETINGEQLDALLGPAWTIHNITASGYDPLAT
jgi:hypothetical protein